MTRNIERIKKETGFAKSFDGTKLYYEVRGEGKPIVMCYGIGCLMNHWIHQVRHFSRTHQVITFDYRAHHRSDTPEDYSTMSVDSLARDLDALLQHLEVEKAVFFGHSFGTQVLVRAYDIFPQYFDKLVFINGFASDPIAGMFGNDVASRTFDLVKSGFDVAPESIKYLWRTLVNNPMSVQVTALLGGFNLSLTALKDIEIYLKGVSSLDLEAFLTLFKSMMSYDGRPVFDRIDVPTLIISGQDDSVTPESYQREMHHQIKKSQLFSVPFGSHCTQLDLPDFVNLRIDQFL